METEIWEKRSLFMLTMAAAGRALEGPQKISNAEAAERRRRAHFGNTRQLLLSGVWAMLTLVMRVSLTVFPHGHLLAAPKPSAMAAPHQSSPGQAHTRASNQR